MEKTEMKKAYRKDKIVWWLKIWRSQERAFYFSCGGATRYKYYLETISLDKLYIPNWRKCWGKGAEKIHLFTECWRVRDMCV